MLLVVMHRQKQCLGASLPPISIRLCLHSLLDCRKVQSLLLAIDIVSRGLTVSELQGEISVSLQNAN